ncbi:MAG TPA: DUF1501 domain-containing protein [Pirellulales bacterium]|jgi:hypothetical protein
MTHIPQNLRLPDALPAIAPVTISRRQLLQTAAGGFGYLALAALTTQAGQTTNSLVPGPLAPKTGHHPARAKRVIFLFMQGGPSHVDTFDHKPLINADHEKPDPAGTGRKILRSPWTFARYGETGRWVSELFPHVSQQIDKLTMLHGVHTDIPNHPQATLQMHTGSPRFPGPSIGAWVLYGLGTENQDLPGFISINPLANNGGVLNYGSGFLAGDYQATRFGGEGEKVSEARLEHVSNPRWDARRQREELNLIADLHRARPQGETADAQLDSLVAGYELAFRMQTAAPQLFDLSKESAATAKLYGLKEPATAEFARQCLLARRCVESGVRFIELTSTGWDHHDNLRKKLPTKCRSVDRPIAALLQDLQQRGLLDDTLVVWGGEFGRTAAGQNEDGRDHNAKGFTMWMAGGGTKPGCTYGATDEYGIKAIDGKMHVHDLHATILYLLGLDHERLTYRYSGRDFRLTDVHGRVAREILDS